MQKVDAVHNNPYAGRLIPYILSNNRNLTVVNLTVFLEHRQF